MVGGGGGAGRIMVLVLVVVVLVAATGAPLSPGPYAIVVGAGGRGSDESPATGRADYSPGNNTTFNSMTAGYGGRGSQYPSVRPLNRN